MLENPLVHTPDKAEQWEEEGAIETPKRLDQRAGVQVWGG